MRRFETTPGRQAQVDWDIRPTGERRAKAARERLHVHARCTEPLTAKAALDQKLGTLLRLREEAFLELGVPEEILYGPHENGLAETDERLRTDQAIRASLLTKPALARFALFRG